MLLAGIAAVSAVVSACSSSSSTNTSPLPTAAPAGPFLCGFLGKDSVDVAVAIPKPFGQGGVIYSQGTERNADGGRMLSAACTVTGFSGSGATQALIADVHAIGVRPDLDQQAVNVPKSASYTFPPSDGVGYVSVRYPNDRTKGAVADLLRGNWHLTVTIMTPAKGRDPVQDSIAIARQVIAYLHLPTTHRKPYPTTTP